MAHFKSIALSLCLLSSTCILADQTWIATTPNSDLSDGTNWQPGPNPPGPTENAIFNFTTTIDTNPTTTGDFDVLTFTFITQASPFTFTFPNHNLTLEGAGIVGANTNATFDILNQNNNTLVSTNQLQFVTTTNASAGNATLKITNVGIGSTPESRVGGQLFFDGGGINTLSVGDNATWNVFNQGTNGGTNTSFNVAVVSGAGSSAIGPSSQIRADFVSTGTNYQLSMVNSGIDSSTGDGNNNVGVVFENQINNQRSFIVGDNATIDVTTSGRNSGPAANASQIGVVDADQVLHSDVFQAGNNLAYSVINKGVDASSGAASHSVGHIGDSQLHIGTIQVGNDATIALTNNGNSNGNINAGTVGYIGGNQLFNSKGINTGDNFLLNATNIGTASGTATESLIGYVFDPQIFLHTCNIGNQAKISVTNIGNASGSVFANNIGSIDDVQMFIQSELVAQDFFNLKISNSGSMSGSGTDNDVGTSFPQLFTNSSIAVGNNAFFLISNDGNYTGTGSVNNVGAIIEGPQFNINDNLTALNNLTLNVTNSGIITGSGNTNFVGTVDNAQMNSGAFNAGNNAIINIINSGNISGTTTSSGAGTVFNQFASNNISIGDDLTMTVSCSGVDTSTSNASANIITRLTGMQLFCKLDFSVGNNANITVTNDASSSATASAVGHIFNGQVDIGNQFTALDNFSLIISNTGTASNPNIANSQVGVVSSQLQFGDKLPPATPGSLPTNTFTVGNNASISVSNLGINSAIGSNSLVGAVNKNDQVQINGLMTSANNLNFSVTNTKIDTGSISTGMVGAVFGSQMNFCNTLTIGDGSKITATNNAGSIGFCQIWLQNGFTVTNGGFANISAINSGTFGDQFPGAFGILVNGSNQGGNALITLQDSSLSIDTTSPTFTIAGLQGDSNSLAQSLPSLIINTPANLTANFAGVIQDFPSSQTTLTKVGPGTQILSGPNTYKGLTSVQQGTLVLTGSVAGNVSVTSLAGLNGLLKGTGTIGGNLLVDNGGAVMPGFNNIGTLTIDGNYTQTSTGTYIVLINGMGQSSLLNINGTATLGGTLDVISIDGGFAFGVPYHILTAAGGVDPSTTFSNVISNLMIIPTVIYDPNDVYLFLRTNFAGAALTRNELNVAIALDSIPNPTGDEAFVINQLLSLPLDQIPSALTQLAGTQYTLLPGQLQYTDRRFGRRTFDVLREYINPCNCMPCCGSIEGWMAIEGGGLCAMGDRESRGMHAPTWDLTFGAFTPLTSDIMVGTAINFNWSRLHFKESGNASLFTTQGAFYGSWQKSCFYGFTDLVFGYTQSRLSRSISFAALNRSTHTRPEYYHGVWYGEAGINLVYCNVMLQPFFGLDVNYVNQRRIREHCLGALDLNVHHKTWTQCHTYLGTHLEVNMMDCITLNADIAWQHRFGVPATTQTMNFVEFGGNFPIVGPNLERNGLWAAVNVTGMAYDCVELYAEFACEWWNRWNAYSGSLGATYRF